MAGPTCQVTHLKGTAYVVELQLYASTLLFHPLQPKIACILVANQRVILYSCINATFLLPAKDRCSLDVRAPYPLSRDGDCGL
jgi:hypothetical protein